MVFAVLSSVLLCIHGADTASIPCSITADSVLDAQRFGPGNLLDGDAEDPESRWASARTAGPHWVEFRFEQEVSADSVKVWGHAEPELAIFGVRLEVLIGARWEPATSVEKNAERVVELRTKELSAKAFRLFFTRACEQDATARVFEVAFFHGGEQLPVDVIAAGVPEKRKLERVTDTALMDSFAPFPEEALRMSSDAETAQLMAGYYRSLSAWGEIIAERFSPVPEHPGAGYYGRGGNQEDDVRPITYAALINAFLSRAEAPGSSGLAPEDIDRCRTQAIAALAYLSHSHVTGPSTCLDGKAWGNYWQSAMWTRCAGLAGWILWDALDASRRLAVLRMVEHEADRYLLEAPKNSEFNDTGAEENAWNSGILALACVMMPGHPRAAEWDERAKLFLYNALSVEKDSRDHSAGDDGKTVSEWVTTTNAHPDVTVENHGLVHVGYLKTSVGLMLEAGSQYTLGKKKEPPKACLHHVPEAFENLCGCMSWDGAAIYFGGNDWKLVHTQGTDISIYAMLSMFAGDQAAARLERVALSVLRRIQDHEDGFYNVRRDIEYGGLVASRLAACYMTHALCGAGAEPLSDSALQQRLSGTKKLDYAKSILHRTPDKFVSFAWGPKRMALALPRNGSWVVWPHFASYLGVLDGKDASRDHADLVEVKTGVSGKGFAAAIRLKRCGGAVQHDAVFVSPPGNRAIYLERITVSDGYTIKNRRTGVVGHEYALGVNERQAYFNGGGMTLVGVGNPAETRLFSSDWLNIGGQLGHVVKRMPGRRNLIRYTDQTQGGGRMPKLQESYSLIGDDIASPGEGGVDYACVVTYLNQDAQSTAKCAQRVKWQVVDGVATVRDDSFELAVDFDALKAEFSPDFGCVLATDTP